MAIYTASTEPYFTFLKDMANTDTNLTLKWDDNSDDLVVEHTGLGIFLEFDNVDSTLSIWVGKSWTSGETLNDRYQAFYAENPTSVVIVVGADYMIITEYESSSYQSYIYIGELSGGDVIVIGANGTSVNYNWGRSYNITKAEACMPMLINLPNGGTTNLDGYYATMPIYVSDGTNLYSDGNGVPHTMDKIKLLLRPPASVPIEIIGTDLILNGAKNKLGVALSNSCVLGEELYV